MNTNMNMIHRLATGGVKGRGSVGLAVSAAAALSSLIYVQDWSSSSCCCCYCSSSNIKESRCEYQQNQPKKQNQSNVPPILSTSSSSSSSSSAAAAALSSSGDKSIAKEPSWVRRNLFVPIGLMSLPTPRVLHKNDPALTLPTKAIKQRQRDEQRVLKLLQREGPILRQQQQLQQQRQGQGQAEQSTEVQRRQQEKFKAVADELFQLTYGKGVTPQVREDFLVRYGCTGWTDEVISRLLDLAETRGIVEIGAGHGQWSRALNDAYNNKMSSSIMTAESDVTEDNKHRKKMFDFVLAYDDNSNLPLNTHIYNQYTQPHRDYFGDVKSLSGSTSKTNKRINNGGSMTDTNIAIRKVLQSWQCRGRVLMLVYPPPGPMAAQVVRTYLDAATDGTNDTVVFVGEGRGGANADDTFFDMLETGDWILVDIVEVRKPPGDKGYEKMIILQRNVIQ